MSIFQENKAKLEQLKPEVRWAAYRWIDECEKRNLQFVILEVFRTQERQYKLYRQGRTEPGKIVTYTTSSNHTKRLACDILPINCSYSDIARVAALFGISHPLLWDKPHFEFNLVGAEPQNPVSPETRLKGLERRLKITVVPQTQELLKNVIARLKDRISQGEHV